MKNLNSLYILALVGVIFLLSSCNKDEPQIPPNEEEVIIAMTINFTPVNGGDTKVFSFIDEDGDGGADPTILTSILEPNTDYNAEVLISTSAPDALLGREDITAEIIEEGDEHQFFYEIDSDLDLKVVYEDTDANNLPIGQQLGVSTGGPSLGILKVILRHQPEKSADGVESGDITNAGGETDVEVVFSVVIG